jgi:hypothetical protein
MDLPDETDDAEYHVRTFNLPASDYRELRDEVHPEGELTHALSGGGAGTVYYDFHIQAKYLLPIAGAIGKSILDVIVDRVKGWLARRPEDRTVEIFGPDDTVVTVVKLGKKVSSRKGKQ